MKRGVITNANYIFFDRKYEKFSKRRLIAEIIYWTCMQYANESVLKVRWLGAYWYGPSCGDCSMLVEKMMEWGAEKFGFSYKGSVLNSFPQTLVVNDKVLMTPKWLMEFVNFIAPVPLETKEDRDKKYTEVWKRFCDSVAGKFCEMTKTRKENV